MKIPAVVGVIASAGELRLAKHMRALPDLFELRLDYLPKAGPEEISRLRRPLIITTRHPAEGGKAIHANRADLLFRFLPRARFVDVELRSLHELREVWAEAARLKIKRICSVHDFARTPREGILRKRFQGAKRAGADIFKVVTRADTPDDLLTLLRFLRGVRGTCCVMATGRFGAVSRLVLAQCGSALVYAALRRPLYPGQLTFPEWQRFQKCFNEIPTRKTRPTREIPAQS